MFVIYLVDLLMVDNLEMITLYSEKISELSFSHKSLSLFDMGEGMMSPQNVFDHCAQTLKRWKLKLCDF